MFRFDVFRKNKQFFFYPKRICYHTVGPIKIIDIWIYKLNGIDFVSQEFLLCLLQILRGYDNEIQGQTGLIPFPVGKLRRKQAYKCSYLI